MTSPKGSRSFLVFTAALVLGAGLAATGWADFIPGGGKDAAKGNDCLIGYDQLDMFDHVIMGFPTATRGAPIYPPQMPIMEALMMLAYCAAVTSRIGLANPRAHERARPGEF